MRLLCRFELISAMKIKHQILTLLVLLALGSTPALAQCAMCRANVESTMSNGRNLAATGLNTGILYLFVVPYLLVAVISYLWYQNSKKDTNQRKAIRSRVREAMSS